MLIYPLPKATVFAFVCAVALFPSVVLHRTRDTIFPPPLQSLAAVPAAISATLAFIFMIALFASAKSKFEKQPSSTASFGPLVSLTFCNANFILYDYDLLDMDVTCCYDSSDRHHDIYRLRSHLARTYGRVVTSHSERTPKCRIYDLTSNPVESMYP